MANTANIQAKIKSYFSRLNGIKGYTSIKSDGNKYELYSYCTTHQALSRNFTLNHQSLARGKKFRFKCSPGPVNNSYSYFDFTSRKGKLYELRNGIEVYGHALKHEIDVCVLLNDARKGYGAYPSHKSLEVALECKFYSNANSLKGEARKYLGMMTDLSRKSTAIQKKLKAGSAHFGFSLYRSFLTNVSVKSRPDIQKFLESYHLYPKFGMLPGSRNERLLISQIRQYSGWF